MLDATYHETLSLRGDFVCILRNEFGVIKDVRAIRNLIVNGGYDFVCDAMGHTSAQPGTMKYTAIGTGATAETATDTQLGTESTRKANAYTHTAGTKVYTAVCTFGAGEGTGSVTESGLFNTTNTAIMLCRKTFAVINKGAADSLEVTWQMTLT